jgi:hypothetical protein
MAPTNSDVLPATGPTDDRGHSEGVPYAGLSGVPSHFRSARVEPSVASYQTHLHVPSGQCIQCFQCRTPDTPGDAGRADHAGEESDRGSVAKIVPF